MDQPDEEKPTKRDEVNIIDQEGCQFVKNPKRLGHYMPDIFAVDIDLVTENVIGVPLEESDM